MSVVTRRATHADLNAISALHAHVFGPGRFTRSAYRVREGKGLMSRFCRVADANVSWPDDATRLSYPDWILDRFIAELGEMEGLAALECMNEPPPVHERADGYIQDSASEWVADLVEA